MSLLEERITRIISMTESLSLSFEERGVSKSQADLWSLIAALRIEGWPPNESELFAKQYCPHIHFPRSTNEQRA